MDQVYIDNLEKSLSIDSTELLEECCTHFTPGECCLFDWAVAVREKLEDRYAFLFGEEGGEEGLFCEEEGGYENGY